MSFPTQLLPGDDDARGIGLDPAFVLPRMVQRWAEVDPARPFLAEVSGRSLTYGQTWHEVGRWATWLRSLGVTSGARVATMVPTSIDSALLWLALGACGAVEVPIDPGMRATFLHHVLTTSQARLCLVRREFSQLVNSASVLKVIEIDGERREAPEAIGRLPAPTDPSCVIFTSGTTGMPKGVLLSWGQFSATVGRIPRSWLSANDCAYCCHPMFHVTGRTPLLSMADVGGRVVLRERFSARAFLDDVRQFGCTTTTAFSALMLATPQRDDDADNPLRVVFGHNPSVDLRFAERFGCHPVAAYGSTEAGFPLMLRWGPPDMTRRWCGRPRGGYSARVVGPDGAEVPDGEVGEMEILPPARPLVMLEYVGDAAATTAAFHDEWYRTGDAVRRHPNGEIEFIDRLNDTLRRHGENISSAAVEAVVAAQDDIDDCAVFGVPDPVAGQEVALVIVARDPATFDVGEFYVRLADLLPKAALPSYISFSDDLPRTPTNKVRKVELTQTIDLAAAWRPKKERGAS